MGNQTLTSIQAYKAMYFFLEKAYKLTQSDDIGSLLGGTALVEDVPAEPAMAEVWEGQLLKCLPMK